jgi:hypothetical protein
MNLSIAKDQLIHGLQSVQNIVSTRTTLPILSNVLLRAGDNKLEFTATDLDVSVSLLGGGEREEKGREHRAGETILSASCANWPVLRSSWKWMRKTLQRARGGVVLQNSRLERG